jgi:hypothetical protein
MAFAPDGSLRGELAQSWAPEGSTAWVFRLLNDVAIAAIESGPEEIIEAAVDAWRPVSEEEPA